MSIKIYLLNYTCSILGCSICLLLDFYQSSRKTLLTGKVEGDGREKNVRIGKRHRGKKKKERNGPPLEEQNRRFVQKLYSDGQFNI